MRFVLGLILVVWCAPVFAQGVTATPDLRRMQRGGVAVVDLFEKQFEQTLALLEADFPADYRALIADLNVIDRMVGEESALLTLAFKRLTELRRKYAARLGFAPTTAHAVMLGHLAGFYDRVLEEQGVAVCGRFAQDGTAVLFELGLADTYADMIDRQSLAYFSAVVQSIETPEPSEAVRPEDWEIVMGRLLEAGAPPSFASSIAAGDAADPDLCPAFTTLLLTISLMETPEAARARADFAQSLTGY